MMQKECEQLYTENQYLVEFVLNKHFYMSRYDEDLQQEGRIALWKACCVYDLNKGKFSTVACTYIFRQISKILRYRNQGCRYNKDDVSLDDDDLGVNTRVSIDSSDTAATVFVHDFLNSLSKRDRKIITLRFSGYTQKQIAESLHVTQACISKRMVEMRKSYHDEKWRSKNEVQKSHRRRV